MRKLYLTISVILIFGCASETKYTHDAEKTLTAFYTWYLDGFYNNEKNIELSFINSNDTTTLDTGIYFNKIRESDFFSEVYIENRKTQIKPCLQEINKLGWDVVENYDGNPAELIKGEECNFLMAYNFLFHQGEGTDNIKVEKLMLNPNKENEVILIAKQIFEKKPNGFELKVYLVKEDKWRITDIRSVN